MTAVEEIVKEAIQYLKPKDERYLRAVLNIAYRQGHADALNAMQETIRRIEKRHEGLRGGG